MKKTKTLKKYFIPYLLKHKKALLFIDSNKVNDQSFKYNHHFKRKLSR
jgi:hypothetical protein